MDRNIDKQGQSRMKKDRLEQDLRNAYFELSDIEEKSVQQDETLEIPEGAKERVRLKMEEQIEKIRREEAYTHLSEEDRYALELGRKLIKEKESAEEEKEKEKKFGRKRRRRIAAMVTAAAALTLTIGITGIGGPERVVQYVQQKVGNRVVEKINSDESNLTITEENEEEAYQLLSDELGTEPVRVFGVIGRLTFERMEFDEDLQMAEIYYDFEKKGKLIFFVNASYKTSSFALDIEDEIEKEYVVEVKGEKIKVREYRVKETGERRYRASFAYRGLEYYLLGNMKQEDFDYILQNLRFFGK